MMGSARSKKKRSTASLPGQEIRVAVSTSEVSNLPSSFKRTYSINMKKKKCRQVSLSTTKENMSPNPTTTRYEPSSSNTEPDRVQSAKNGKEGTVSYRTENTARTNESGTLQEMPDSARTTAKSNVNLDETPQSPRQGDDNPRSKPAVVNDDENKTTTDEDRKKKSICDMLQAVLVSYPLFDAVEEDAETLLILGRKAATVRTMWQKMLGQLVKYIMTDPKAEMLLESLATFFAYPVEELSSNASDNSTTTVVQNVAPANETLDLALSVPLVPSQAGYEPDGAAPLPWSEPLVTNQTVNEAARLPWSVPPIRIETKNPREAVRLQGVTDYPKATTVPHVKDTIRKEVPILSPAPERQSRYPKRTVPRKNYGKGPIRGDDDFISPERTSYYPKQTEPRQNYEEEPIPRDDDIILEELSSNASDDSTTTVVENVAPANETLDLALSVPLVPSQAGYEPDGAAPLPRSEPLVTNQTVNEAARLPWSVPPIRIETENPREVVSLQGVTNHPKATTVPRVKDTIRKEVPILSSAQERQSRYPKRTVPRKNYGKGPIRGDDDFISPERASRYPKRTVPRKNYKEEPIPQDDDFIFCDECGQEYEGDCPTHGALEHIEDSIVPDHITGEERAIRSIPRQLMVGESSITGAGKGVWARQFIGKGTQFGPYKGKQIPAQARPNEYCWELKKDRHTFACVDGSDPAISNWMRYVNCATRKKDQNLFPFQYKGEMFYRTNWDVEPGDELFVWYGDRYAARLGIDVEAFHRGDSTSGRDGSTFQCTDCAMRYSSLVYLEHHKNLCRKRTTCIDSDPADRDQTPASKSDEGAWRRWGGAKGGEADTKQPAVQTWVREEDKRFGRQECDVTFSRCNNLTRHKRLHTVEKPYRRKVFGARFAQNSGLAKHTRLHAGKKPCRCEVCGAGFTRNFNLAKHNRIHTGEKLYACEVCNGRFMWSMQLTRHKILHAGGKPCRPTCEVYGPRFTQNSSLTKHKRLGTCTCESCGANFKHKRNLTEHKRIHTGERIYRCDMCDAKFTWCAQLTRHKTLHAGGSVRR